MGALLCTRNPRLLFNISPASLALALGPPRRSQVHFSLTIMAGKLPINLLSAIACARLAYAAPAEPTITAPAILPRQLGSNFIGFVESDSTCMTFVT
jgi:hypothetical protein